MSFIFNFSRLTFFEYCQLSSLYTCYLKMAREEQCYISPRFPCSVYAFVNDGGRGGPGMGMNRRKAWQIAGWPAVAIICPSQVFNAFCAPYVVSCSVVCLCYVLCIFPFIDESISLWIDVLTFAHVATVSISLKG